MKTIKLFFAVLLFGALLSLESCGSLIVSSGPSYSTPPWFHPNRVVNLRYVYFPNHMVYYDLSMANYIYLDNGIWITVKVLPQRFNGINFRHVKQIRVNNYYGDNIKEYHRNTNTSVNSRRGEKERETNVRRR